ncbi:hypothetical protein ACOMHN_044237 [Nucella lapillus]
MLIGVRNTYCRIKAPSAVPPCTANLCSNTTRVLSCPQRSVLHVRNVTCQRGQESCAPPTWLMLYSLCEGRQSCDAWGLRMLRPLAVYCQQEPDPWNRNVFMDYVCVPNSLIHSECRQQTVRLTAPFGVLMSPGFTGIADRAASSVQQCDWLLESRDLGDVVHVTVHMAYSRRQSRDNKAMQFLRVDYNDCESRERIMREFYDLSDVNIPVTSCGSVRVTSWLRAKASYNSPFLLSYQMAPRGSSEMAPPGGMQECERMLPPSLPPTLPHPHTTSPTFSRRNYGPGRTMFDYSDTIRHMGADSKMADHDSDDTFQLKLTLLYIFFGVVIVALIIALIYVLMSYRGISRRGREGSDSSEKTALWRHEDTPLHTFSHNSHATLADVATDLYPPSPHNPPRRRDDGNEGSPDSQVVACTVHAKEEEKEEEERRLSTGSAFSSFLSGKDMDLQDLLDSFHPSDPAVGKASGDCGAVGGDDSGECGTVAGKDAGDYDVIGGTGDYDIIAGQNAGDYDIIGGTDSGDYDIIGGKDSGDYDSLATGRDTGDYDRIADGYTADGRPLRGGENEANTRSNSFQMNGDAGNIYESIEDQQGLRRVLADRSSPRGGEVPGNPTRPPPPPLPCNDQSRPTFVEHYTINDDDYAMVRKPKSSTLPRSVQSDVSHGEGAHSSANGFHGVAGLLGGVQTKRQTPDKDLGFHVGERV